MATHSSIPVWRISWTEWSGGLQSMGLQRVRHDLATKHKLALVSVDNQFIWIISPQIPPSRQKNLSFLQQLRVLFSWQTYFSFQPSPEMTLSQQELPHPTLHPIPGSILNPVLVHSVLVAQSWPTLCESMDCSPPDSSFHGILQARILEWVAILFARGSSQSRD